MKTLLICLALLSYTGLSAQEQLNEKITVAAYNLHYNETDASVVMVNNYVASGLDMATHFFEKEFKHPVNVYLMPNRAALDSQWQTAWGMPSFKSECWMVGSGVESRLDLLSPSVWDTEACEHNAKDTEEIRKLIHHELIHVLHSDYNRSPSFTDINNIDWFVEGLATYASGQLDAERLLPVIDHVKKTAGPNALSLFWKGEHKYGLSGSLVYYIDRNYGRELLSELLQFTDVDEILKKLKLTEEQLISNWKKMLLGLE